MRENGGKVHLKTMGARDTATLRRDFKNWVVIVHKDVLMGNLKIDTNNANGVYQLSNIAGVAGARTRQTVLHRRTDRGLAGPMNISLIYPG